MVEGSGREGSMLFCPGSGVNGGCFGMTQHRPHAEHLMRTCVLDCRCAFVDEIEDGTEIGEIGKMR